MKNQIYVGDNLKIMSNDGFKKFFKKIKTIYIDPPYNTNNDKSYNDTSSSTDWISFMKPRIELSKELLKDDGVIFISIDDNEYANLKILCDEIFGKENFLGTFITQQAQRSNAKHINTVHEYVLCFAKNKTKLHKFVVKRMDIPDDKKMIEKLNRQIKKIIKNDGLEVANKKLKDLVKDYCYQYNIQWLKNYSNVDEDGRIYFAVDLSTPGKPRKVKIDSIGLELEPLHSRGWTSDKRFIELYENKKLCFKNGRPYAKHYLIDSEDNVPSLLKFFSRQGTNDLKKLGLEKLFDTPKPVELLKFLIRISTENDGIVLDFFAGSGSTAQAVYEINKEDNKKLNYILIQTKEKINKKSDVYTICKQNDINPYVSDIMRYRINTFLKKSNTKDDYDFLEGDE